MSVANPLTKEELIATFEKNGEGGLSEWTANLLAGIQKAWADPAIKAALIGSGVGAGLGAASLAFGKKKKSPLARILSGAAIGGLGGLAYPMVSQMLSPPSDVADTRPTETMVKIPRPKQNITQEDVTQSQQTGKWELREGTHLPGISSKKLVEIANTPVPLLNLLDDSPAARAVKEIKAQSAANHPWGPTMGSLQQRGLELFGAGEEGGSLPTRAAVAGGGAIAGQLVGPIGKRVLPNQAAVLKGLGDNPVMRQAALDLRAAGNFTDRQINKLLSTMPVHEIEKTIEEISSHRSALNVLRKNEAALATAVTSRNLAAKQVEKGISPNVPKGLTMNVGGKRLPMTPTEYVAHLSKEVKGAQLEVIKAKKSLLGSPHPTTKPPTSGVSSRIQAAGAKLLSRGRGPSTGLSSRVQIAGVNRPKGSTPSSTFDPRAYKANFGAAQTLKPVSGWGAGIKRNLGRVAKGGLGAGFALTLLNLIKAKTTVGETVHTWAPPKNQFIPPNAALQETHRELLKGFNENRATTQTPPSPSPVIPPKPTAIAPEPSAALPEIEYRDINWQ